MDDTGIEPGTSHMLSECDNQLHQTPNLMFIKYAVIFKAIGGNLL